MTRDGRPRFYDTVSVRTHGDGYGVLLDTQPLRTPAGSVVILPVRQLAEAVADEWSAQKDHIRTDRMPITRLINTALDRTAAEPVAVVDKVAAYGETDLLCHWADYPEDLVLRQRTAWQPVLDWATDALGIRLRPVAGIRPHPQEPGSLNALRGHLEALGPIGLTAVEMAASLTGSVVIALALACGRLDTETAWTISRVDEDYQIEKWGEDDEALRQAAERRAALEAAATVLRYVSKP